MDLIKRIVLDFDGLNEYYATIVTAIDSKPELSDYKMNARYNIVSDVYNCLEFWLVELCSMRKTKISYKQIKAKNELAKLNKYLLKEVGLNLTEVKSNYDQLQSLRSVRNCVVHNGAHVKSNELDNIPGIKTHGVYLGNENKNITLVCVTDAFIEISIENAKLYLTHVATSLTKLST